MSLQDSVASFGERINNWQPGTPGNDGTDHYDQYQLSVDHYRARYNQVAPIVDTTPTEAPQQSAVTDQSNTDWRSYNSPLDYYRGPNGYLSRYQHQDTPPVDRGNDGASSRLHPVDDTQRNSPHWSPSVDSVRQSVQQMHQPLDSATGSSSQIDTSAETRERRDRVTNDLSFRYAENELSAGAAASFAGGSLGAFVSSAAKEHLAQSFSAQEPHGLLHLSQWWEEHLGVPDGGKLLARAATREQELDSIISEQRSKATYAATAQMRALGPAIADTWRAIIDRSFTQDERMLFAVYQHLMGSAGLSQDLINRGVVPQDINVLLHDPNFVKAAEAAGPGLLLKLKSNITPQEAELLKQHDSLKNLAVGTTPHSPGEVEQQATAEKEILYERLKVPATNSSITSMYDLSKATRLQMQEIAEGLKPQVDKLYSAARAKGRTLTEDEKALSMRFRYFKNFGSGQLPPKSFLTAEEAGVISNRAALGECLGKVLSASELPGEAPLRGGWSNFARGMMFAGGVQLAQDVLERGFSLGQHSHGNRISLYANSIGIPLALSMNASPGIKFATGVGIGILGSCADSVLPPDTDPKYSWPLRPNPTESALVGLAAGWPLRAAGPLPRAALITSAIVCGKLFSVCTGGPTGGEIHDRALELFRKDKTERSASSLSAGIDEFKLYGLQKEGVLEAQARNWVVGSDPAHPETNRYKKDRLNWYRGAAMLLTAVGERRQEDGYLIGKGPLGLGDGQSDQPWFMMVLPDKNRTRSASFILQQSELDLGGTALKSLSRARKAINLAEHYTQSLIDKDAEATWRGTPVRQSEIADLETVGKRIDSDIEKIYGPHDINVAYDQLKTYFSGSGESNSRRIRQEMLDKISQAKPGDEKYLGKLYRDLTLIDLSLTARIKDSLFPDDAAARLLLYGNAGARRDRGFDGALDELAMAEKLTDSPDNQQLEAVAAQLKSRIASNSQEQGSSYNILGTTVP